MPRRRLMASQAETYFKKGHDEFSPSGPRESFEVAEKKYYRMDRHTYNQGIWGQNGPPSILRPKPTEKGTNITEDKSFDSNIFANPNKLFNMMTTVYKPTWVNPHNAVHPSSVSRNNSQKMQGLCATVIVKCILCNYINEKFELFKRLETNGKGNSPPEIDVRLWQHMSVSETSLASIQCLVALILIPLLKKPWSETFTKLPQHSHHWERSSW